MASQPAAPSLESVAEPQKKVRENVQEFPNQSYININQNLTPQRFPRLVAPLLACRAARLCHSLPRPYQGQDCIFVQSHHVGNGSDREDAGGGVERAASEARAADNDLAEGEDGQELSKVEGERAFDNQPSTQSFPLLAWLATKPNANRVPSRDSLCSPQAQDDFAHKQVLETMQDLEATQQKMYSEWEQKNNDLRAQLEEAQSREAGVIIDAKGKDEELVRVRNELEEERRKRGADEERMRRELEEERRKRGAGEEKAEEMMRSIEENERKQMDALESMESRNRALQMQLDEAVHRGEEKTGEMVRKEMKDVEEMQQRLWKGWESENVGLRRQLAESAKREVDARNAAVEKREVAEYAKPAPSFDDSEKSTGIEKTMRCTTIERGEIHSDIVRRHLNSTHSDSAEYEVVDLGGDEDDDEEGVVLPTRHRQESTLIIAAMKETEKDQLEEWRQLQDTSNSLEEEMRSAQKEEERAEIVRNMAELETHQQNVYREWEEVNAELRKELEMAKKREAEAHAREVEAQRREAEAREEAMRSFRGSAEIRDEVSQQRQTIDEMNLQLKLLSRR